MLYKLMEWCLSCMAWNVLHTSFHSFFLLFLSLSFHSFFHISTLLFFTLVNCSTNSFNVNLLSPLHDHHHNLDIHTSLDSILFFFFFLLSLSRQNSSSVEWEKEIHSFIIFSRTRKFLLSFPFHFSLMKHYHSSSDSFSPHLQERHHKSIIFYDLNHSLNSFPSFILFLSPIVFFLSSNCTLSFL